MSEAVTGVGEVAPPRRSSSSRRLDREAAPQSPRAFLRFRFVEAVGTCFPNLPVSREEGLVEHDAPLAHLLALKGADDDVLDAGAFDERGRFARARVDALQFGLARPVV